MSLTLWLISLLFLSLLVEREHVQKKTFTKWVNSHLCRINCKVVDLYTDLRDGKLLIKLLEILSGERLVRRTSFDSLSMENMIKLRLFHFRLPRISVFHFTWLLMKFKNLEVCH